MKNFEQVRDVLDHGKELHDQIRAYYETLKKQTDQSEIRLKMALDYLSRHEDEQKEMLERFEENARSALLNTWLQFAPSDHVEELLAKTKPRPGMSVDEVVQIACAFDDALVTLYKEAAAEMDDPKARNVFNNLAEASEKEKQRIVRDTQQMLHEI
ncbi:MULTISPECIES: hypothetical protein [Methylococcus]|jgi:rubrerythrin|uniref:Rubrerythrin n=1 Tax=Methylococcus capsulatus TaxID=414 RepID=A0AA35UR81_METCP|nr:hypothetical protein [Methylococcus capsulatus]QXP86819.1 hypothetical protein KW112_10535 [Methylococcus capsulatus]QXP91836.1 hypothetical protein KW114_06775 [Methylococcus capsulatus]QXP93503.1 hypothetical protein KW113_14325 [Methylococcus capsulatus]UQN11793.1 hypothetical protein M3M30_12280 [Methylococcus capsulatus]CAI8821424.1 Rubrerythrin [Methylococcus capsulatus]